MWRHCVYRLYKEAENGYQNPIDCATLAKVILLLITGIIVTVPYVIRCIKIVKSIPKKERKSLRVRARYRVPLYGGLFIVMLLIAFEMRVVTDEGNVIQGNNYVAKGFSNSIGAKSYHSIDEAMKKLDAQYKEEEVLYQAKEEKMEKIFLLGNDHKVTEYEFAIKSDGTYENVGSRILLFEAGEGKYDWVTTVRADLSNTTKKSYKELLDIRSRYGVLPAWGITTNAAVKDITVEGQPVDHVQEFKSDGKTYYLWIIDDLKTEKDAKDITIKQQ